ncbi:MAG: hypothetical protein AAF708_10660 [Deinococcota bacterium]
MPKPKAVTTDKLVVDDSKSNISSEIVGCGAPTPELARHIPNQETVKALQDTSERRNLIHYASFEDFKKDMLSDD